MDSNSPAQPTWWPTAHGYAFLAQAIDEIGRAMFGPEWSGAELTTRYVEPLPPTKNCYENGFNGADHLLRKYHPDLQRPSYPIDAYYIPFTDEEWRLAREIAQRLHDEQKPARDRLANARRTVVEASQGGELVLAIRRKAGGSIEEFSSEWCNTETWKSRLAGYDIDRWDPFEEEASRRHSWDRDASRDWWIFVIRDSLDRVTSRLRAETRPRATAAGIQRAIDRLVPILRARGNSITRQDALAECEGLGVNKEVFEREVWPTSRQKAGLTKRAPAGRKREESVE